MRSKARFWVTVLVLVAAACGQTPSAPVGPSNPARPSVTSVVVGDTPTEPGRDTFQSPVANQPADVDPPELTASCGPVEFDAPDIDVNQFPAFTGDLDTLLDDHTRQELSPLWWDTTDWFVAEDTSDSLVLFGHESEEFSPVPGFAYARFEVRDGEWRPGGWGQCSIRLGSDGYGVASFEFDPDHPLDPAERALHVLAMERACANGRAPTGRDIIPIVVETETTIEITILVASFVYESRNEGTSPAITCQRNPSFSFTVPLREPYGNRAVFDASEQPPNERPWPIPRRGPTVTAWATGDRPASGTANVVSSGGTYAGGLLFNRDTWSRQAFEAWGLNPDEPGTIIGFVTPCEADECIEECESAATVADDPEAHDHEPLPDCAVLPRLGPECVYAYEPTDEVDTIITLTFTGNTCTIEATTAPIE